METKEKVFLSTQLICMLPPMALKVMAYLINWQSQEWTKFYVKQWVKFLKMSEDEINVSIQTLIDNKLVNVQHDGDNWMLQVNKPQVRKYMEVPLQKVHDHEGFTMATFVKWNKTKVVEKKQDIEDMSKEQIEALILRLQASLNEKKEIEKLVKFASKSTLPKSTLPSGVTEDELLSQMPF